MSFSPLHVFYFWAIVELVLDFWVNSDDISAALKKAAPTLGVTLLLDSLKRTLEFEAAMAGKFNLPVGLPSLFGAGLLD